MMGVTADIWRSLRRGPRAVVRAQLSDGPRETRALGTLMLGCGLVFVAQWPRLARLAQESGAEFPQLVSYELIAWLMAWPLIFYLLALLAHGAARLLGGRGTPAGARVALFWSWLAASPLAMLTGASAGLAGPSTLTRVLGALWLGAFAWLWWQSQREAGAAHAG